MRIIKDGRKEYKCQCDKCKSLIGFFENDIQYGYWNSDKSPACIICPVCDSVICLEEQTIL